MPLTAKDFDRVVDKLGMVTKPGKHQKALFYYEGKVATWTMRSHGRGDLGRVENAIKRQLLVNTQQLRDLVQCPMNREHYVAHLKQIGAIETH